MPLLCAAALLAIAVGWYVVHLLDERAGLKAAVARGEQTLVLERRQRDVANRAAVVYQKRLDELEAQNDETRASLRAALDAAPDVYLPGRVGRVLRGSAHLHAAAPAAQLGQAAPQVGAAGGDGATLAAATGGLDEPVSCKVVSEWGLANQSVADESEAQVDALQRFYEEQRALLERGR